MPNMTRADFGPNVPTNAANIIKVMNDLILYHEESVFWKANPSDTDKWEADIIKRCVAGDRSGDLACVPDPIY